MPPDMQMPSVRTTTARSEKNTEQRASVHTIENHTTQRAKITHTSSRRIQYFTRAGRAITRRDERRARGARARSGLRVSKALERAHTDHSVLTTPPSTAPRAHATAIWMQFIRRHIARASSRIRRRRRRRATTPMPQRIASHRAPDANPSSSTQRARRGTYRHAALEATAWTQ